MAAPEATCDSEVATLVEIKGSLGSFAPSIPITVNDAPRAPLARSHTLPSAVSLASKQSRGSRLYSSSTPSRASLAPSRVSLATSRVSLAPSFVKPASKTSSLRGDSNFLKASKSRVTIATVSRTVMRPERSESGFSDGWGWGSFMDKARRQRSIHSLGTVTSVTGSGHGDPERDGVDDGDEERARPGPFGDSYDEIMPRPRPSLHDKIPEGLAKLLRGLPEPRDLAPLVRSVVISADMPSRHGLHFKSVTKVQRIGLKPAIHVARAPRVRIGRRKQERDIMYEPTYWLRPKEVPNWRLVRALIMDTLAEGLKDVHYTAFLAENGSRILAAAIVQRFKRQNLDRYRIVAKVRIAQRLNQGMAMHVACMWDTDADRFAYVQFENATLAAQAVLFLVYRD